MSLAELHATYISGLAAGEMRALYGDTVAKYETTKQGIRNNELLGNQHFPIIKLIRNKKIKTPKQKLTSGIGFLFEKENKLLFSNYITN
jgi:hypothetical protein